MLIYALIIFQRGTIILFVVYKVTERLTEEGLFDSAQLFNNLKNAFLVTLYDFGGIEKKLLHFR